MEAGAPEADPVAMLRRWEHSGAVWRVLGRPGAGVTVGLFSCDGGEEMSRFTSSDPSLLAWLAGRSSSEAGPAAPDF